MPPKPKQSDAPQEKKTVADVPELPAKGTQKFIYASGTVYEGEYDTIDGQICRHGFGKLIENLSVVDPDECPGFDPLEPPPGSCRAQVFDGLWAKDAFQKGKISYVDGSEYNGQIDCNGSYVTGGVYTFPCGSKWIGGFLGCEMHGEGHFIDKEGVVWKGTMEHNNCSSMVRVHEYIYKEPVLFEKDGDSQVSEASAPSCKDTDKVESTNQHPGKAQKK